MLHILKYVVYLHHIKTLKTNKMKIQGTEVKKGMTIKQGGEWIEILEVAEHTEKTIYVKVRTIAKIGKDKGTFRYGGANLRKNIFYNIK